MELAHHAGTFMLKNMAVEHVDALESMHQLDAHGLAWPQIDDIVPGPVRRRCDLAVEFPLNELELRAMDVERMIHV